jgi:hypothetical protein
MRLENNAAMADEPEPGEVERVLTGADLAVISASHPRDCSCWDCLERFVGLVEHWRTAAAEYHADRIRRGGGPEVVPRGEPTAEKALSQGGRVQSAEQLDAEHRAGLDRRGTPQCTIDAVVLAVRNRGLAALLEPDTVERLARCDATARDEINWRIARMIGSADND